ncbi:MAG TPA: hypothetical protein VIU11_16185 [Nakamurella sp.]
MAATVTRRALRRARLGGRHTYRAAARHRVALAVAAAVAVLTVGSAVAASPEPAPAFTGPPSVHLPMHGPMPDGPPGWSGRH